EPVDERFDERSERPFTHAGRPKERVGTSQGQMWLLTCLSINTTTVRGEVMITRSRQVALALTVVLTAGAACQARDHQPPEPGRPAPSAAGQRGFTLVASGD